MAVAVAVHVPQGPAFDAAVCIIGIPVAVVVHAVANLGCTGPDLRRAVVAVIGIRDIAGRLRAGQLVVAGRAVAVSVEVDVPERLALDLGIGVIGVAVAVVVNAVAHLGCTGVDLRGTVVAVRRILRPARGKDAGDLRGSGVSETVAVGIRVGRQAGSEICVAVLVICVASTSVIPAEAGSSVMAV